MRDREFETIEWTFEEETGVGTVVLDRPESLNALSSQLRDEIVAGVEAFEALDDEADGVAVRALVVEGAGDAFCAGADIDEFEDQPPGVFDPEKAYEVFEAFAAPVIAKIDGYCLGGGLELALSCDFRIASERSELGQPEVDLGLIPGGGGTQRLAEIVGPSRTKELCMTGRHVPASQAAREGIVDSVHPASDLDRAVADFADEIAAKPPLAIRAVKDAVNMYAEVGLRSGRRYEKRATNALRETADHAEGVRAFRENRDPEWQGK